jgi:3-methylfumaryl-CoA hydratase
MTGLASHVTDWRPRPVDTDDVLCAQRAAQLAATLDLGTAPAEGDPLPLLWHWVYFLDWPRTAELGPDGHPLHGHFLPPIPNRRRMFAGGRLTVTAPLIVGAAATRHSEVVRTAVKQGRTGELLFVTVRHTHRQDDEVRIVEEQDLVYRSDDGSATPFARTEQPLPPPQTPWHAEPQTHPALLFRFSALTANAHRIHYDEAYTTGVEGFPALVVHGPLLAVHLAELVRAHEPDRQIGEFVFRLQKPVFVGDPIRVQGTPGDPIELAVVSGAGDVHASAQARPV